MSEFKKNHTLHVTGAVLLSTKTRDAVDRVMKMRIKDVAKHGLAAVGFSHVTVAAMGGDFRMWMFEAGPEKFEINTAVEDLVRYKEAGGVESVYGVDSCLGSLHIRVHKAGHGYSVAEQVYSGNLYVHSRYSLVTLGPANGEPKTMVWFRHANLGPVGGPTTEDIWRMLEDLHNETVVPEKKKPKAKGSRGQKQ